MVPAGRPQCRDGGELRGPRLHGDPPLGLRPLGEDAGRPRCHVQGDRSQERLLPPLHPAQPSPEGGGACGGICQGMRCGHPSPSRAQGWEADSCRRTHRAARRAPHLRDDHRINLCQVGEVVPRPSDSAEPMGQCRPLGAASPSLPPHCRVSLAGGAHGPRDRDRGDRGDREDARRLRDLRP